MLQDLSETTESGQLPQLIPDEETSFGQVGEEVQDLSLGDPALK